jgi:hypothetical protein
VSQAEYIREWRKTPEGKASMRRSKQREVARREAVKVLIKNHEAEFNRLYDAMLQAMKVEEHESR